MSVQYNAYHLLRALYAGRVKPRNPRPRSEEIFSNNSSHRIKDHLLKYINFKDVDDASSESDSKKPSPEVALTKKEATAKQPQLAIRTNTINFESPLN
jgi:hypothetical protein